MTIDDKTFFILSSNHKTVVSLAPIFGLTEEEMNHPNAGPWMADCISQLIQIQTAQAYVILRKEENKKIENYESDPFKDRPNPLIQTPAVQK